MTIRGRVQNGVVVPSESATLPEGAEVNIEVIDSTGQPKAPRQGGQWKGRGTMADDFDDLPTHSK